VTQFVSPFTKLVAGIGHEVEDANPTPIIFRNTLPAPVGGSGSPTPQAGRAVHATGSPYPGNNPLPL